MPYGQTRPLSLFFVTIAASGDRKSTADNEALIPVRMHERNLKQEYERPAARRSHASPHGHRGGGLAFFLVRLTALGEQIVAVGGNEEAARLSGINIYRVKIIVYTLSGLLSSLAGFVLIARIGGRADRRGHASANFYRLFLAPGLYHCQGGPGPNVLDVQGALERWVEQNVTPDTITATKYRDVKPHDGVAMSRALCPFPKRAHYNGAGAPAEESSFSYIDGARYPSPLPSTAYLR